MTKSLEQHRAGYPQLNQVKTLKPGCFGNLDFIGTLIIDLSNLNNQQTTHLGMIDQASQCFW